MAQNILIGISGGIAAYKIPQLVRLLKKQGDNVRIVMSEHAHEFVTATTLQAVSGEAVRDALFDPAAEQGMGTSNSRAGRTPTSSPRPAPTPSANWRTASPTTS